MKEHREPTIPSNIDLIYCEKCGAALPVRERLLLILPDRELYDYLCTNCASSVGQREVTAGEKLMARAAAPGRPRRAVASQQITELERELRAPRERWQKVEEGDEPGVVDDEISGPGDTMPKMERPPLNLKVWLAVGFFGYGSAPGILELAAGRLSLTVLANGTLRDSHRQILEQAVQRPGLANELDQGMSVEIFSLPLARIHDLKIGRGLKYGTFTLVAGRVKYLFYAGNPQELQPPMERSLEGIIEGISEGVNTLSDELSSAKEMEDWGKELSKQMESMETAQNRPSPPVIEIIELASPGKKIKEIGKIFSRILPFSQIKD